MEESKHHFYFQEGRAEKLQASQLHLSPRKSDGDNPLGKHFQSHEGTEGNWELSVWIYEGEMILNQPASLFIMR